VGGRIDAPARILRYSQNSINISAWLRITTAAGLLCGLSLSWRLWLSSRLFPLAPVSDSLPAIPFPFDLAWLLALLGLLLAILVAARPGRLIAAFLVLAGLLSLWDQTRWQPWFYQYVFMLAAIGCLGGKRAGERRPQPALDACRLIVACTYLWSGLQKLNVTFVREAWPDMAAPLLRSLPAGLGRVVSSASPLIPALEILVGLGLVTRRYRNGAVLLAIGTHAGVLLLLVASGENRVVWPWNAAMAVFVFVLFWQDRETRPRDVVVPRNAIHLLIAVLFGVLPALSLVDSWDSYLSAALYSGNTHQAVILIGPEAVNRLPAPIRRYVWRQTSPFFVDINRWAYGELDVPLYPEPRVYRRVAERVCSYPGAADVRLLIRDRPYPVTGRRHAEIYDCGHLDQVP
jgi:hypothetical protein